MISALLFWAALAAYVLSSIGFAGGLAFDRRDMRRLGVGAALLGLVVHSGFLAIRWIVSGHGPYISTYEILSSNAWMAVVFFLLLQWRSRALVHLGVVAMPLSFIMMGVALMGSKEVKALSPTLRSAWLVVHVVFAKLTVAALLVAVALSVFYLAKGRQNYTPGGFLDKVPSLPVLDENVYRLIAFSFITLTLMIITGSIWANNSWGSYWSWDPTETWSLVVWLIYGLYLHGRLTFRWKGKLSSWYVIASFVFSLIAFFVIPYFIKSLHSQYMVG